MTSESITFWIAAVRNGKSLRVALLGRGGLTSASSSNGDLQYTVMTQEESQLATEWSPSKFFDSERRFHPFALILLNQPLNWNAFEKISASGRYPMLRI